VPDLRLHTSSEFLHCALEEEFTEGVLAELDRPPAVKPIFRPGIQDKPIQHILVLLNEELETEKPLGRLYVDFLAHALATRYLMLECSAPPDHLGVSALPSRLLRRVQEKIEANLDTDLKLESLAAECGYSRAHFLRMFRAATGVTPHQYVLDLRIHRAKQCLIQKASSLIDVALACGFSSQSHMTSVFREHVGVTPARFRHGLRLAEALGADQGRRRVRQSSWDRNSDEAA
jgi:AraC family transcriptional regulator